MAFTPTTLQTVKFKDPATGKLVDTPVSDESKRYVVQTYGQAGIDKFGLQDWADTHKNELTGGTTTTSPYATLPGAATSYSPAYGGIPQVTSPIATAGTTITGNLANLSNLYNLAQGTNALQEQQLQNVLESAIPGYGGLVTKATSNIAEQLAGELPRDVTNQIIQSAAERGIITGSTGSPNANAATLRALGLSSLGMQQQGQQNLLATTQALPHATPFDVTSMFVTPEQQQAAQTAANTYASAPVPSAAAAEAQKLIKQGTTAGTTGGTPDWFATQNPTSGSYYQWPGAGSAKFYGTYMGV